MKRLILITIYTSLFVVSLFAQNSGITIGDSNESLDGTIRYNATGFEGLHLGNWLPFTGTNTAASPWTLSGTDLYYTGGNVGIQANNPLHPLHVTGNVFSTGELISTNLNQARFIGGDYGVIHRNDGTYYYILATQPGDQYGSWSTARPLRIEVASGNISLGNGIINAVDSRVGIGTSTPTAKLHITGLENNGTTASLKVTSGAQNMLLDGNEIDSDEAIGLYLNNNNSNNIILANGGGNVGIGQSGPAYKLDIDGDARVIDGHLYFGNGNNYIQGSGNAFYYKSSAGASQMILLDSNDDQMGRVYGNAGGTQFGLLDQNLEWIIRSELNSKTDLYVAGNRVLRAKDDGKIGIGAVTTYPGSYKLYVETGILTERVKIATMGSAEWADYVFADDYELKPLNEVEQFVQKNKHLPNIPSAQEIEKNGYELQKMDARLLEKIEELYLHSIELEKENTQLENKVNQLIERIEQLENQ